MLLHAPHGQVAGNVTIDTELGLSGAPFTYQRDQSTVRSEVTTVINQTDNQSNIRAFAAVQSPLLAGQLNRADRSLCEYGPAL